jgi:hypothetical protein
MRRQGHRLPGTPLEQSSAMRRYSVKLYPRDHRGSTKVCPSTVAGRFGSCFGLSYGRPYS